MVDYTSPITATFELQRQTIEQSQEALEQGIEFQKELNKTLVDGLDGQKGAQRRAVELQREAILDTLETVETNVPGTEDATAEVRDTVNEQFEQLLDDHEAAFDNITAGIEDGAGTYDEFASEYLDALNDQLNMVIDAHEELETQSIDAANEMTDQLEQLQAQVEDVQQQITDMQD